MEESKKKIKKKGRGLFLFIKASVSSQIASWTDFLLSFVFFTWVGFEAKYATAVGAIAGGVVNCCINYKWTFRPEDCSYRSVALKYLLVWLGSFFLNVYGTEFVTNLLRASTLLDQFNVVEEVRFTIARLGVSLVVSILWNFMLQRYFVFSNVRIKDKVKKVTTKIKH